MANKLWDKGYDEDARIDASPSAMTGNWIWNWPLMT